MKCPICGKNNKNITAVGVYGNTELLQELSKTKQALDKAIWWLNEIVESHRCTPISTAEMALAEIKRITKTKG